MPRAAGLFGQVCGARGDGRSCGAGLSAPRRAGWRRAKPAGARFYRASLYQPARRGADGPYKAPPERPTPLFAPRRSARPAARDTDRFLLPPSLGGALFRPHALRTPFAPAPPLRCVALRAPRPPFPWPATRASSTLSCVSKIDRSDNKVFALTPAQLGHPRFQTLTTTTSHRNKKKVAGCARHLGNTNAAQFFFQLNISKAKVGHFGRTCQGSKCQKLPNSLRRKRLRRFTNFYHFSTLTEPPKIPSEAFENFEF